jgi:membrane protease YdiL (CAAX protease family)
MDCLPSTGRTINRRRRQCEFRPSTPFERRHVPRALGAIEKLIPSIGASATSTTTASSQQPVPRSPVHKLSSFVGPPSHAGSLTFVNPLGGLEVTLWVIMAITAGSCEELVFRGYFQKQFLGLTRSAAFAVLAQAVLFGICHRYQGVKQVILISVLGALFGILAQWRKSLRPGMIAHAWADALVVIPVPFQ